MCSCEKSVPLGLCIRVGRALERAHDVHNALIEVLHLRSCERARVDLANVFEDGLLALRLVDGRGALLLELANGDCSSSAFGEQEDDLLVQLIDLLAPVGDFHVSSSICEFSPHRELESCCLFDMQPT